MPGGKPRQILAKCTIKHWMRYMMEMNFKSCPRDSRGPGIC